MAKTARKKSTRKKASRKRTRKTSAKRKTSSKTQGTFTLDDPGDKGIEVKGGRLVVRLSREDHPEVFEVDRLIKQMKKIEETFRGKRKHRDLCEFLAETEKSLQIMLRNQLEDAMRTYLD